MFLAELKILVFFDHHHAFPFLSCAEISNQADLVKMLPKLYDDLMPGRTNTLNEFIVHIHHVNVVAPTSNLAKIIIRDFCVAAAAAIKFQSGHEYDFDNDGEI